MGDRRGGSSGYAAAALDRDARHSAPSALLERSSTAREGRHRHHGDAGARFDAGGGRATRGPPADEWGRGPRGRDAGARAPELRVQSEQTAVASGAPAPAAAAARADQFADSDDEEEEGRDASAAAHGGAAAAAGAADTSALPMVPAGLEHLSEEELLAQLMGLQGFDSSKGQEVPDNTVGAARGAVRKNQVRKHRQYMNRKDGFNRPLDKIK